MGLYLFQDDRGDDDCRIDQHSPFFWNFSNVCTVPVLDLRAGVEAFGAGSEHVSLCTHQLGDDVKTIFRFRASISAYFSNRSERLDK